jgi:hypothetical protein
MMIFMLYVIPPRTRLRIALSMRWIVRSTRGIDCCFWRLVADDGDAATPPTFAVAEEGDGD